VTATDAADPSVFSLFRSVVHLPRPILCIYLLQFLWWLNHLCAVFWWTTYVPTDIYAGDFKVGVHQGVLSMILFSLVSLASSRLVVPFVTSWLGELRTFHFAQFVFTGFSLLFLSSAAWVPWAFAGSAVWYPFIDSTPFVLIEQFLDDDEKIDDDLARNGGTLLLHSCYNCFTLKTHFEIHLKNLRSPFSISLYEFHPLQGTCGVKGVNRSPCLT
jgi:hypothetical protein